MKIPHLGAPAFCRRAWVRFLRSQGATIGETAAALGLTEIEVARLSINAKRPTSKRTGRQRLTR